MSRTSIGETVSVRHPAGYQQAAEPDVLEPEDEFERARR